MGDNYFEKRALTLVKVHPGYPKNDRRMIIKHFKRLSDHPNETRNIKKLCLKSCGRMHIRQSPVLNRRFS